MKFIDRTGETGISNQGLNMKIIRCKNVKDIDIQFDDGFVSKNNQYTNFKSGSVNNPYFRSVCGVGYIGEGKYKTGTRNNKTVQYETWRDMLRRCYDDKCQEKHPTYKECPVIVFTKFW